MSQGNLLYAQSGGVTAVINATAAAVIETARARGVKVLAALAGLTVIGALVFTPLLPAVVGHAYQAIEPMVWLFALQGAALAAGLLGVYAGLAIRDRRLASLVWVVAIAEALAVALRWHGSIQQVLTVVLCGSLALVVAAGWLYRNVVRQPVPAA